MVITVDELKALRGYNALVQGEVEIEDSLLEKSNKFKSKAIGFVETRKEVLLNVDKRKKAILRWIELVQNKSTSSIIKLAIHHALEVLLRDSVPKNFIEEFVENTRLRIKMLGWKGALESIDEYLSCGDVVPIAQTYREIKEENMKGVYIYARPKK